MSLSHLCKFINTREKYINLFAMLNQHDVPRDVKNYILGFADQINIEKYNDFDEDLKVINKNLTPDALYLLNYILVSLIKDITKNAFILTQHRRAKRLSVSDVEYALGIYPRKNSSLIHNMIKEGVEVLDQLNESKYEKSKLTINTYLNYNTVKKWMKDYFSPMDKKIAKANKKYNWDMEDVQIAKEATLFLTAILDVFVETILHQLKGEVNADDILKVCESNIEIKSILLDLFPLY